MKKIKAKILIIIGTILILSALGLTIHNFNESKNAEDASIKTVGDLSKIIAEDDSIPGEDLKNLPIAEVDGNEYVGIIQIPSIDVSLPVLSEYDYSKLKISPCRYYGDIYENNMVIAAHNYKRHFGSLKSLKKGEKVIFIDIKGNKFKYEIAEIIKMRPEETEKMIKSEYPLTLFTCNYDKSTRITARCKLIEEV